MASRSRNGSGNNEESDNAGENQGIDIDDWLFGGASQHEAEKLAVIVGLSLRELYLLDFREFLVYVEAHAQKEAMERQKMGYMALLIRKAFHKKRVSSRDFFQDADRFGKQGGKKLSVEEIKKKIAEDTKFFERIDRDIANGNIVRGNKSIA